MPQYLLPTGLLGEKDTASVVEDLAAILEDHTCNVQTGVLVTSEHPAIIAFCQSILAGFAVPVAVPSPNGKKPSPQAKRSPASETREGTTRTCEHCGIEFVAKRKDSRHCSVTCRQAAYHNGVKKPAATIPPKNGHKYAMNDGDFVNHDAIIKSILSGDIEPGTILTRDDDIEFVVIEKANGYSLRKRSAV